MKIYTKISHQVELEIDDKYKALDFFSPEERHEIISDEEREKLLTEVFDIIKKKYNLDMDEDIICISSDEDDWYGWV